MNIKINPGYKLVANIPGVKVTIMPDPLNAKVEMTEAAQREFAWRMIMESVFSNVIYSAYYDLDPKNQAWFDSLKNKSNNKRDAFTTLSRFVDVWFGNEDEEDPEDDSGDRVTSKLFDRLKKRFHVDDYIHELNMPHSGDCTAVACSCTRCHAESVLGLNTLLSGKHVNSRLGRMYWNETATQEEKDAQAARIKEFNEKYPSKQTPEEKAAMIKIHQPRWDAEDEAASKAYALHKTLIGTTGESK